jgi:calcineurin-like phosphoesterase family protein
MNNNVWFTADLHTSHRRIIEYCNRPFSSVEEMDKVLLHNFFSLVKYGDTVYYLGDLSFNKESIVSFLNTCKSNGIKINFIEGNHDVKNRKIIEPLVETYEKQNYISVNGQGIFLCHYSMRTWHKSHFNSWQLFAHSHGMLKTVGKQHDVGVDNNNFYPINLYQVIDIMKNKPDNENYKTMKEEET